ncbi:hypothetical protein ACJRO7_033518 [Eucalyptus globulus]|uniref:Aminotransferase class V domain-containing protein n=1 Tax=Eucalyptus globulus TaxID=34317 RepID=A0ABD3JZL2_EUCGL
MELEQPRQPHLNNINKYINPRNGKGSPLPSPLPSRSDLCKHSASFRKLGVGVPAAAGGISDVEKVSWLRSQIIGSDAEFDSPFGRRRLTYADSTASGRCIRYVEDFIVDNILPFYDANRPILGSFSACSNVTGICTDTRAVAKLLYYTILNSAPYVEIDMRSGDVDGYDAIFLSVHKFLGGPGSPGILLMSKALYRLGSFPPSTSGGGTVDYVNGFNEKDTLYVEDIEERENAGTPQIIQITRAALAFWLKDYVGNEVIEKLKHKYIKEAIERLSKNQNIEILGNKTAKRQAILSFLIYSTTNSPPDCNKKGRERGLYLWGEMGNERDKPLHGPFVATLLNDLFGIQARGGCACASPYGHALLGISEAQSHAFRCAIQKGFAGVKPGWTRVSFPHYLSEEEFEYIIAALEFVASFGQRFLLLYHFNLKTGNWTFKKKTFMEIVGKEKKGKIFILNDNKAGKNLNGDAKHESLIAKYMSYWESAKHIAGLLPKFPSPPRLQEDIDPELLYFRL